MNVQSVRSWFTWKKSLIIVSILGGVWWFWKPATPPLRYVLTDVTRGTLVSSITASGQVAGSQQVDLKPEKSGNITQVFVSSSQMVKLNDPIVQLDDKVQQKVVRDASRNVANAVISLESAKLSLQKLEAPVDSPTMLSAQSAYDQADRAYQALLKGPDATDVAKAEQDFLIQKEAIRLSSDGKTPVSVRTAYDNAVPMIQSAVQNIQQAIQDVGGILGVDRSFTNEGLQFTLSALDSGILLDAKQLYGVTKLQFSDLRKKADALSQNGESQDVINATLLDAIHNLQTTVLLARRTSEVLTATVSNSTLTSSALQSLQSSMQSTASSIATKQTSLVSEQQSLEKVQSDYRSSVASVQKAELDLAKLKAGATADELATAKEKRDQAKANLDKVKIGTDPLDLQSSRNSVREREISLSQSVSTFNDAKEELAKYLIRAPFDGQIAKVSLRKDDPASPSTAIATIVTVQKVVQVTVNEVDATKIKVGQKATISFDALPDLTMAGAVMEVDSSGTVTQGVVSYAVRVVLLTDDERVKTGMNASASIVIDVRPDVLLVPNSAVSTQGGGSMVKVATSTAIIPAGAGEQGNLLSSGPMNQSVQVGASNDAETEIVSGISEGDKIVTRTIDTSKVTATASTQTSLLNAVGGRTAGGGGAAGAGAMRSATGR